MNAVADTAARPPAPTLSNAFAAATSAWLPGPLAHAGDLDRLASTVPVSDLAASPVA